MILYFDTEDGILKSILELLEILRVSFYQFGALIYHIISLKALAGILFRRELTVLVSR